MYHWLYTGGGVSSLLSLSCNLQEVCRRKRHVPELKKTSILGWPVHLFEIMLTTWSIAKDVKQSPLESAGWILGGAGLAGIGLWIYTKHFGGSESLDDWKTDLQKELGIDRLKINKSLCFGTKKRQCPTHNLGQFLCKDLDCYYGPLGQLVDAINMAKKTLDVAVFRLSSETIGNAILEAHERGAQVRVVTDAESAFESHSPLIQFRKAGISVRQRISPYHMHHKFIIVDGEVLINGSMNFSDSGAICNWENVVITSEPGIVVPFINEFQSVWEDFEQGKEIKFSEAQNFRKQKPW